jgi:hypothetical protein
MKQMKKYPSDYALKQLKKFYEQTGSTSSSTYQKSRFKPTIPVYINLFGSWGAALEAAGITKQQPKQSGKRKKRYTRIQIINRLRDIFFHDSTLMSSAVYFDSRILPTFPVIIKEFGTWENALVQVAVHVLQSESNNCSSHI